MRLLDEKRAGLVAVMEALLPLEILGEQKQREQFVLSHFAGRRDELIQRSDAVRSVKQHFDVLIVDEASHLPELEAGLPFFLLGSNVCLTNVLVGNPDEHPVIVRNTAFTQKAWLDKSDFSQLCAFSSLPLSESFPHF